MYCINCGKKIDDSEKQKFCPYCGCPVTGKETEVSETVEREEIKKAVQETIKESMAEAAKEKSKATYQPVELIMMLGIVLAAALLFAKWINVDIGIFKNFKLGGIPGIGWLFDLGYSDKIRIISLIGISGALGVGGPANFVMFSYILSVILAIISFISFWGRGKTFYFSSIAFFIMLCVTCLSGLFFIKYSSGFVNAVIRQVVGVDIGGALLGDIFSANIFIYIELGIGAVGTITGIHTYRINKDRLLKQGPSQKISFLLVSSIVLVLYGSLLAFLGAVGLLYTLSSGSMEKLYSVLLQFLLLGGGIIHIIIGVQGIKRKEIHKLFHKARITAGLTVGVVLLNIIFYSMTQRSSGDYIGTFIASGIFYLPIVIYSFILYLTERKVTFKSVVAKVVHALAAFIQSQSKSAYFKSAQEKTRKLLHRIGEKIHAPALLTQLQSKSTYLKSIKEKMRRFLNNIGKKS